MQYPPQKALALQKGLVDFEPWLLDVVRMGIAQAQTQPHSFWQTAAARLKDAGAGAAANWVLEIPAFILPHEHANERLLHRLADLYLLVQAFRQYDTLGEPLQAELLMASGVTISTQKLIDTEPSLVDVWQVIGLKTGATVDPALQYRRVWLRGKTSDLYALLLEFDFANSGYKTDYAVGNEWHAELVFYPGNAGLRAIVKLQQSPPFEAITQLAAFTDFAAFANAYTQALADAPFLPRYPCAIAEVVPLKTETGAFILLDTQLTQIPLAAAAATMWQLLAISGGAPITVFGEWSGRHLEPLSVYYDGRVVAL